MIIVAGKRYKHACVPTWTEILRFVSFKFPNPCLVLGWLYNRSTRSGPHTYVGSLLWGLRYPTTAMYQRTYTLGELRLVGLQISIFGEAGSLYWCLKTSDTDLQQTFGLFQYSSFSCRISLIHPSSWSERWYSKFQILWRRLFLSTSYLHAGLVPDRQSKRLSSILTQFGEWGISLKGKVTYFPIVASELFW